MRSNDGVIQLSEDAKPSIDRYKKSSEKRGCFVAHNRVYGTLAVARSIGDYACVSKRPKITKYIIPENVKDRKGMILLQACDGLFDVVTSNEAGKQLKTLVGRYSLEKIATLFVNAAFLAGSQDNISVIISSLYDDPNDTDEL